MFSFFKSEDSERGEREKKRLNTKKLTFFSLSLSPPPTGLQSIPVSWWGVVVASVLMFVALAVNVMPAYSICVHLGLDHKPHLLPSEEHREHFRNVAEKRRKEAEERLAREASLSKGRDARQKLQRMVSRRLPRKSDGAEL